jgi:hypothetical protein
VKPEKCSTLVIIKGKVSKRTLKIDGTEITSIAEEPMKYLGKWYNMSLNEQKQIETTTEDLRNRLRKIEKSKIPGRYKAYMVQHMLMPRLMWPLSIYNIPMSKVEEMERQIMGKLKRWLGLPKSWVVDGLYSRSTKLQLT